MFILTGTKKERDGLNHLRLTFKVNVFIIKIKPEIGKERRKNYDYHRQFSKTEFWKFWKNSI